MTNYYSKNIQTHILRELLKATESIKVAVAWFTNDILYHTLIAKLEGGVKVELILNDDEINNGDTSLNFQKFAEAGGILKWYPANKLMHLKICIIDDAIAISGSYNWTYKAESSNEELITISKDDPDAITQIMEQYNRISKDLVPVKVLPKESVPIEEEKKNDLVSVPEYFYDSYGVLYQKNPLVLFSAKELKASSYAVLNDTTEIKEKAFEDNEYIHSIEVPNSVLNIGKEAFARCKSLERVILPDSLEVLNDFLFRYCCNLSSVHLPLNLKRIGVGVFDYCSSLFLSYCEFPVSVEKINDTCWHDCDVAFFENCKKINPRYSFFSKRLCTEFAFPAGIEVIHRFGPLPQVKKIVIPSSVKMISEYAFENFEKLEEVEFDIHSEIYELRNRSFSGCKNLRKILLPPKLRSISDGCFEYCESLESFDFPENLEYIGREAFLGCSRLHVINFKPRLHKICRDAFLRCDNLVEFSIYNTTTVQSSFDMEFGIVRPEEHKPFIPFWRYNSYETLDSYIGHEKKPIIVTYKRLLNFTKEHLNVKDYAYAGEIIKKCRDITKGIRKEFPSFDDDFEESCYYRATRILEMHKKARWQQVKGYPNPVTQAIQYAHDNQLSLKIEDHNGFIHFKYGEQTDFLVAFWNRFLNLELPLKYN